MKILKEGKIPEPTKTEITCDRCESKLEIYATDLIKRVADYNRSTEYHVNCAFCQHKIHVFGKNLYELMVLA